MVYRTCMSRARSRRAIPLAIVAAITFATGCKEKAAAKPDTTEVADAAAGAKPRMSPKAAAMETVLLWDASVQKIEGLIREAEAAGDTADVESLRQKLQVSQDGAAQARRKLKMIEDAEAMARQQADGAPGRP